MIEVNLQGKVAVVTGAGQGIGRAVALALGKAGADIVVNDINRATAVSAAEEIRALGRQAVASLANVAERKDVDKMTEDALNKFGKIDILVNNAGVVEKSKPFWDTNPADWDRVIDTNIRGVLNCSQAVVKHMLSRRTGKIVSLSSCAGLNGDATFAIYSITKAGIIAFTKSLAREVAQFGITVNCVAPGFVDTPILAPIPRDMAEQLVRTIPMGRLGRPEEIAHAILFLASDLANYITGETLIVSGGHTMR